MGWLSIDAVDGALNRTKRALIRPFIFWKWIKLGIIVFFIGGGGWGGLNFYSGGFNQLPGGEGMARPTMDEILGQVSQFWHQYSTIILIAVVFLLLIFLVFSYISNVMEFVLVESVVTDIVNFWAYSGKYVRQGLNLFLLRLVLGLFFLTIFILAILPVIRPVIESFENITQGLIVGVVLRLIVILLAIAIVNGIIQSLINLSIPLVMYHNLGIIEAFKKIWGNVRRDGKQILVYWVFRIILRIAASIVVGIAALLLFVLALIILAIPAVIFYFALQGLGIGMGNILFWMVMVPYGLIALVVLVLLALLISVPVPVFMKYHMLVFLRSWYPDARIPLQDIVPEKPAL